MPATFKQAALRPHSSSFSDVTDVKFARRVMERTVGFDNCLILLWEMFMGYHGS